MTLLEKSQNCFGWEDSIIYEIEKTDFSDFRLYLPGIRLCGHCIAHFANGSFFLVTVFCFANSSQKLHDWFVGTKMYQKHLESFVQKKGMTVQTKVGIIVPVTLLMGFGFFMMMRAEILVPSIILAVVWVCHIIYFVFGVKTRKPNKETAATAAKESE